MTKQEFYEFLSDIVICFYSKSIKISLKSLKSIIKDKGWTYDSKKELKQRVAAAYNYWEKKDPVVHHAIAYVFSDKHGNHVY